MTDERFQQPLEGPLSHPLVPFQITRLALALRAMADSSPEAEKALEAYCAAREAHDRSNDQPNWPGETLMEKVERVTKP